MKNNDFVSKLNKGDLFHTEFESCGKKCECFCEFEEIVPGYEGIVDDECIQCSRLITCDGIESEDLTVGFGDKIEMRMMTEEEIEYFNNEYSKYE